MNSGHLPCEEQGEIRIPNLSVFLEISPHSQLLFCDIQIPGVLEIFVMLFSN